jgi:hypothetical protein
MKAFNAENDKEFGIERFSMKFGNGNAISVVFGKGNIFRSRRNNSGGSSLG